MCGVFPFTIYFTVILKVGWKKMPKWQFQTGSPRKLHSEERGNWQKQIYATHHAVVFNRMRGFSQMKRLTFNLSKDEGASNSVVSLQTEIFKMLEVLGEWIFPPNNTQHTKAYTISILNIWIQYPFCPQSPHVCWWNCADGRLAHHQQFEYKISILHSSNLTTRTSLAVSSWGFMRRSFYDSENCQTLMILESLLKHICVVSHKESLKIPKRKIFFRSCKRQYFRSLTTGKVLRFLWLFLSSNIFFGNENNH